MKSRVKLRIANGSFYSCFLIKLNLAISTCLYARRHANCADKKNKMNDAKGVRERETAATKMEMQFAIGPRNFSNLNLILSPRHDIAKRAECLARSYRECVTIYGGETHCTFTKLFLLLADRRAREYVARAIYVAARCNAVDTLFQATALPLPSPSFFLYARHIVYIVKR